jgi:hypothetical protein
MSVSSLPLPHVNDVVPLGPGDASCLDELRAVLAKYGALNRFGLVLLHEHFVIEADEVLVEECDESKRTFVISPQKRKSIASGALETSWRLDTMEAAHHCRLICERSYDRHDDKHRIERR